MLNCYTVFTFYFKCRSNIVEVTGNFVVCYVAGVNGVLCREKLVQRTESRTMAHLGDYVDESCYFLTFMTHFMVLAL